MRDIYRKLQVTCGLVVLTGPFCLMASAQTYVDLEAERAAAQAAGMSAPASAPAASDDPYGAQPAQAYPATSYGVNNAPAATTGIAPAAATVQAAAPAAAPAHISANPSGGADVGSLFLQIQQLKQEIMELNGKVEEQAYQLNTLKEQSLQRYMDLDKRLGGGGAPPATTGAPGAANTKAPPQTPAAIDASAPIAAPAAKARSGSGPAAEQPGEAASYRSAYALVESRQFPQAIPAFQKFLKKYPDGAYAANAHYWLGELYLVSSPPDLEASRQSFALLLSQYPDNIKAPDALYKLGKVQFMKGNREKAKEYLDLVISQYSGTNNAVVKLAQDFIAQNY